jgi:hypothetical protein
MRRPSRARIVGLAILIAASAAMLAAEAPQKADFRKTFSMGKAMLSSKGRGTDVFKNCLHTKESSALESGTEDKYYAPGVGLIKDAEFVLAKFEKGR